VIDWPDNTELAPPREAAPAITLIAAMDENGLIGAGGGLPWHLPADLRWFKRTTMGKPILMGRRTFAAIGRALPGRRNLVLTRDRDFAKPGCVRVASLDDAIAAARNEAAAEIMVIGGAQVYALALSRATRLLVTRIRARYEGDTYFPAVDWRDWHLVHAEEMAAGADTPAACFMTWQRR
jgi:dihydrofolate reductase